MFKESLFIKYNGHDIFAPIFNHANILHIFFLQDCTNLVICKPYHAQITKDPSWYWIFLMIFHFPFQLVAFLFQLFLLFPPLHYLVICSGGTKGDSCPLVRALSPFPHLPTSPVRGTKWPKISHFWQFLYCCLPHAFCQQKVCSNTIITHHHWDVEQVATNFSEHSDL